MSISKQIQGSTFVWEKEREENSKIVIGDSDVKWEEGIDAIKQKPSINKGNFGIVYRMQITVQEDMAVILNPRGDMFKGAIKWEGDTKELIYILPCGSSAPVVVGLIPKRNWIK